MNVRTDITRILLVEDDPRIGQALMARLKHEGYEVYLAKDAITAVSEARKTSPDVAILDISLPGGDGFDVARRIDVVLPNGRVPKIFITASKEPGLRKLALEAGGVAFIEKPFTSRDLRAALELAITPAEPPAVFD